MTNNNVQDTFSAQHELLQMLKRHGMLQDELLDAILPKKVAIPHDNKVMVGDVWDLFCDGMLVIVTGVLEDDMGNAIVFDRILNAIVFDRILSEHFDQTVDEFKFTAYSQLLYRQDANKQVHGTGAYDANNPYIPLIQHRDQCYEERLALCREWASTRSIDNGGRVHIGDVWCWNDEIITIIGFEFHERVSGQVAYYSIRPDDGRNSIYVHELIRDGVLVGRGDSKVFRQG